MNNDDIKKTVSASWNVVLSVSMAGFSGTMNSRLGAYILDQAGWHLSSVGLTQDDIGRASALTSYGLGLVTAIPAAHFALMDQPETGRSIAWGASILLGAVAPVFTLPVGAELLDMLNEKGATGYAFAAGGIATGLAITTCVVTYKAIDCYLGARNMRNANVLDIPPAQPDEDPVNVEVADLELDPQQDPVNMMDEISLVDEPKNLCLHQAKNLGNSGFDDIRAQGQDIEANAPQNAKKQGWLTRMRRSVA